MSRRPAISRLRHRIGEAIAFRDLWAAGDRVAVAVSGGLDSVCLLDLLVQIGDWHRGRLSVVTVDHGVRDGSAADADFVESLAKARGLAVHRATLAEIGASEAALREARYAVFASVDADVVALAHHRNDQAETAILQLLRGSGSRGLGAMRWKRGRFVRPLLEVSRTELRQYADHRELVWREDPSNADPSYLRNRVRSEVMPLLEDLRPGAAAALARSAANLAADDAYFESLGVVPPPWRLDWIRQTPAALVRRSLATVLGSTGRVDAALKMAAAGAGSLEVGASKRLEVVADALVLTEPKSKS